MFGIFKKPLTDYEATLVLLRTASILHKAGELKPDYILRGVDKYCSDNRKKINPRLLTDIRLASMDFLSQESLYYVQLFDKAATFQDIDFCVGKIREIFERSGGIWKYPESIDRKIEEAVVALNHKSFSVATDKAENIDAKKKSIVEEKSAKKPPFEKVSPALSSESSQSGQTGFEKIDDHPSKACRGINEYLIIFLRGVKIFPTISPSRVLYDFRAWLADFHPEVYEQYSECFHDNKLSQMRDLVASRLTELIENKERE
jgi:hypothetical protein